jgi:hypothetical protein
MKIRFGLHLDGQQGFTPINQLGVTDVGPLGLLGILESQLGLIAPTISEAQRIVQYRECLLKVNNPDRFFFKTFAADDFGAAASLLSWRDEWYLHGWSGDIGEDGSLRQRDMAAVEKVAHSNLSPGTAQRLQTILDALTKRRILIESIALVDPIERFPILWQRVLKSLPTSPPTPISSCGQGLLGKLQNAIVNIHDKDENQTIDWVDDGSLVVIRSETSLTAGRWIAHTLRASDPSTLYVATSQAGATDAFLTASAQPRQGLSESSAFRPALQLLPLLLELLWLPMNFTALMQFLTHPICPISGKARRKLARVQSQYPGIGGPRWQKAIEEIEEIAGDRAKQVRESIEFWIEHPRFDPSIGAPISAVLERTQRLADFFRKIPSEATPARQMAYAAGYSQANSFSKNLASLLAQGVATLSPRQLDQLVTQATSRGSDNPLNIAEVGALPCINQPGAALEAHSTVLWGPLDAPAMISPWPWSKSEITALANAGCSLPDTDTLLQSAANDWLRPILSAKDKLILVLAPEDRETHPVWQMINALIPNIQIVQVERMLLNEVSPLTQISHKPLPEIKRWWQLPRGTEIPPVKEYSFTQLERQIFNPFHWLLANAAKLRSGSLLSLAEDFRLKGLLSHSLVERLCGITNSLSMSDADFECWFNPAFDQLISEEGAVYLMPGRQAEKENLRQTLHRALQQLREILQAAKVCKAESERHLSGHFVGGLLGGDSDLILTNSDGTHAIIDMKWAGKTHRTKLAENRHLQLAIYSELLRQETGQWSALAYFLFSQGKLLTRDDHWFPGINPVKNQVDENTAQLWQRFLVTWKWRQAQFAQGLFEVVLEDSDDADSNAPEDGLAIEVLNSKYNDCLHLAGWRQDA